MPWWIWTLFLLLITSLVLLDLGVFNRQAHRITFRESLGWTGLWVSVAMLFGLVVYGLYAWNPFQEQYGHRTQGGGTAALEYLVGYLVEYSLSIDNVFVIAIIMSTLAVPGQFQHRLLFWGVLTAVVLRGVLIIGGAALIDHFEWMIYVFGLLLVYSAIRLMRSKDDDVHPEKHFLVRWMARVIPMTHEYHGSKFIERVDGRWVATPMLVALLMIETSDVMFAFDSIPAVFGITRDPFIVFTSNIFAVMGLRSLYFALAGLIHKFDYLKTALVVLLFFIGMKMLLNHFIEIPNMLSLLIISGIIASGIVASILFGKPETLAPDE